IPHARGVFVDTAALTLTYRGFSLDTVVLLHGTVPFSTISTSLNKNAIAFDTISDCSPRYDTIYIRNASCDSAQIMELQLGLSSPFKLIGQQLNTWIAS